MGALEIVFGFVFIAWMLKVALKPRVLPTRDDWVGLIDVWLFVPRKRKYFKEKYFEQERVRESGQQLRSGGDGGENVSDGLGSVGVFGTYGGEAGFGQLSDDDFRRVASPFDDRFDGRSKN